MGGGGLLCCKGPPGSLHCHVWVERSRSSSSSRRWRRRGRRRSSSSSSRRKSSSSSGRRSGRSCSSSSRRAAAGTTAAAAAAAAAGRTAGEGAGGAGGAGAGAVYFEQLVLIFPGCLPQVGFGSPKRSTSHCTTANYRRQQAAWVSVARRIRLLCRWRRRRQRRRCQIVDMLSPCLNHTTVRSWRSRFLD